ncbi:MAG: PPOX class F420-dependent oxidoreductase [Leifsonia sp.]
MKNQLSEDAREFVTERHLATLSTLASDGTIHVVPVGFTYLDGTIRIITSRGTSKVRNVLRCGRASIGQIDGGRWISFEGPARVLEDPESVAQGEQLYGMRYRTPRPNPERVVIAIEVAKVMGSAGMREHSEH